MAKRMPASLYVLVFSSGVICHRFFDALIPLWLAIALPFCAILFYILLLCTAGAYWQKFARLLCVFIVGIVWTNFTATNLLHSTIDSALEKQDIIISGRIVGVPVQTPYYSRFDFIANTLSWKGKPYDSPAKIRLKAYHNISAFKTNQVWQFTVRLKRPHGYQNPGSQFNYETYLFEHRIRATGYVRNVASNRLLDANFNTYSIAKFRARISTFIQTNLSDNPHHGVLTALIVGIRGTMSDADWSILRNTGTIHLVAISGLHIGLVCGLVMWLATRIWRLSGQLQTRIPAQTVAVICGLVAGFCYALLAGMTIPTQRAVIMLAVVAISMLLKRRSTAFDLLILALGAVLLIDPLTPLASGFWLSFAAVAVIICCLVKRKTKRAKNAHTKITGSITEKTSAWMSIQFSLSFGMAPLLLLLFHQLSLIAPLANLVAIPVIGLIVVPVALFGLCLFALGLSEWALLAFEYALIAIDFLWSVLQFLAASKWSIWQPSLSILALMFAAVGVALLFCRPSFPARLTAVLWFVPLLFYQPEKPDHGAFKYTMLEVGHGLASVVETRNHTLVYDTGPKFRGGMDAGKTVVVPYLKSRGIQHIDKLIISHPHNDHAGGYHAISSAFNINHLLAGVPDKIPARIPDKMDGTLTAEQCRDGQQWLWDGVRFEVLWPLNNHVVKGNNASCVLMISSKFGSLLLTGDIESPAEKILVATYGNRLAADILQVPHQGSKTSSTIPFLARVNPQLALLSSGYLNRFGHPHKVISQRYAMRQIPLINTAYSGALTIHFDHSQQRLKHRDLLNGYWFGL